MQFYASKATLKNRRNASIKVEIIEYHANLYQSFFSDLVEVHFIFEFSSYF